MPGRCAALPAQFEFEFSESGHDGRHGAASRSSSVDSFPQRAQHDLAFTEIGDGAGDFGDRTAKPIDGRHNNRVPSPRVVQHRSESRALRSGRPRELVGKDSVLVDAGGREHGQLRIEILAGGANSGIAEDRGHAMTVSPTPDSPDLRHAV